MSKDKDPHYVAKMEKAISDKYGEDAIQNPKNEWNTEKEKEITMFIFLSLVVVLNVM